MANTEQSILEALRAVRYPGFSRDVVSLGVVRSVSVEGTAVGVEIVAPDAPSGLIEEIERQVRDVVNALDGVDEVRIRRVSGPGGGSPSLRVVGPAPRPSAASGGGLADDLIPGVRSIVAVASGKGGVGKSTVAVNLAVALARGGLKVGLLDADIYGPSIPLMTGLSGERPSVDPSGRKLIPFERHQVRLMSLGFLVESDSPVIWRGPMVMKAIEQLLRDVQWGELDLLVVDMPPGTGDAQLTLSQRVRLSGAVIVTTPQDVALADAIKGVAMFRRVGVPVLGIVENMSYFSCPHCGERSEVFGHGGGRKEAERQGVPFLGEIPLDGAIRASGDSGSPVAAEGDGSAVAGAFAELASTVRRAVDPAGAADQGSGGSIFDRFRQVWDGRDET